MSTIDRERLREIRTFSSLVKYLRDELGWPIDSDDFEELFFDFTPEELGIDPKNAAKVQEIRQLRPPPRDPPPWGIFFIKFEPKRLPVVALRRILSALALRKRSSANPSDRAAFARDDLLFISSYGEGEDRQLTFAHFTEEHQNGDLPILNVLGWDQEDTALHLDDVHDTLRTHLRWPENQADADAWRQSWAAAFTLRHREVITTSRELALRLADLARDIRKRVNAAMRIETEKGPLTKLMKAFQQSLIHDLKPDDFADMYAQTIAYGLLSARVSRPGGLVADNLADMVPITNPFLRELMETFLHLGGRKRNGHNGSGIDFDELGINDVVQTLRQANMEAVLRDFGNRNPQEDPVIHFYELFLKEYDAQKRMQRGVFYTPRPVVSYIVRSVHELLQTEFGLTDGLADITTWAEMLKKHKGLKLPEIEVVDPNTRKVSRQPIDPGTPFVQILDPATGTATFLVEVIDMIHQTMVAKWKKEGHPDLWIGQKWNEYVPNHLLPRLHGYELMMAPYAIAHMKIGLKLFETGYKFGSGERARIYLTNALEPPQDFSDTFEQMAPALAHEAKAVNDVKQHNRFTVVIGNPPYSVSTQNRGEWAMKLIGEYKEGLNEKKHTLDDDYVKFVAFSQHCLQAVGVGVWGFITNHGYIKNPTFRGMRRSLLGAFSLVCFYDLHGNSRQRERADGSAGDENVFDIQQGVTIAFGIRQVNETLRGRARCANMWGTREAKYATLARDSVGCTKWSELKPCAPFFLFIEQDQGVREEYLQWPSFTEAFCTYGSGIKTDRDELCMDSDRSCVAARMKVLFSGKYDEEFVERYNVRPSSSYNIVQLASRTRYSDDDIIQCLYRPFDVRWLYYRRGFTSRPAFEVIQHMLAGNNLGLLSARTNKSGTMDHFFCTRLPTEVKVAESTTQSCLFPLYLVKDTGSLNIGGDHTSNFSKTFLERVNRVVADGDTAACVAPEAVFNYVYAVVHSPTYRSRYAEFLKVDFPRVPIAADGQLFHELTAIGDKLIALHVLESPLLDTPITTYRGHVNPVIEKTGYMRGTVWLNKNQTCGVVGVPEGVWNFSIGGYQVCEKWLKDRKGRTLSQHDIAHYQKIVVALNETIRLMKEIDEVIERHGGWPGAFITDPKALEELRSKKA